MHSLIIITFILGYIFIILEHPLKLDKTVPALLMTVIMWSLLAIGFKNGWLNIIDANHQVHDFVVNGEHASNGFENALLHHLAKTSEILIFLICAMTVVELIDIHHGFSVIKGFVNTKSRIKLLWITGGLAFFLSAVIDNLTATIIIVTLLRALISDRNIRLWYVGMAIIAANAGGAWSPIGDVTTTMLWMSDKVSAVGLVKYLIIPSLVCFVVPFALASCLSIFKGYNNSSSPNELEEQHQILSSKKMLFLGLGAIVFVPIFKIITGLPPYLGMVLALGVVWMFSEYIRPEDHISSERRQIYSTKQALRHIELSSILFFFGILMSVGAMETMAFNGIDNSQISTLRYFAQAIQNTISNQDVVIGMLGVFSAIIDNVPLVAATMGMFTEAMDAKLWHFIAYVAGTGGSMLIIGSAAGVTAMGMENMDFGWYFKKISPLAMLGFISGGITFLLLYAYT